MYELLYVSLATEDLSEGDLRGLVQNAQKSNAGIDVTGLLAFDEESGSFFQILEGRKDQVLGIYSKIKTDSRHKDVRVLLEDNRDDRRFPDWSMELVDAAYFKAIVFENLSPSQAAE